MDLARMAAWLRQRWVLWLVLVTNVGGIAYGFYYYGRQFSNTPWYLWPLVPDSPFAVLLMSLAIVLLLVGRERRWVNLLGAAAMVKVGVWTAVILAWFPEHFAFSLLPNGSVNVYLFYLHLGMALEALIVLDRLPQGWRAYVGLGAAFLAHDIVDYTYPITYPWRTTCQGLFPHTVPCDHLGATFLMTAGLSIATFAALCSLGRWARSGRKSAHP